MGNIVLLIFCFAAGIALRAAGRFPGNASASLNAFIINISLPAMSLAYLRDVEFSGALLAAAAAPWLLFAATVAIILPLARALALPRPTTGCLILVSGTANTSFMGLPLIEAFYGPEWIGVGIVMDQLGSYMVLAFLGIAVARLFAAGPRPTFREIALRVATFPPMIATAAALALMNVPYPAWLEELLLRLAATVAPLALVSVGLQLRFTDIRGKTGPLALGLAQKLLIGRFVVLAIYVWAFGAKGTIAQVMIFEVAMAPMIGASIVAMENDLDPQLATLLVGLGVPLSFLTLAAWSYALGGL